MKNNGEFPKLTILNDLPERTEARLTTAQKYGSLFWLGVSGLVVTVLLVGWFGTQLWAMRDIWRAIYVLHEESMPVAQRLQAAEFLASDPRVEPGQVQPMIFRKTLPDKARYLLAERLDEALSAKDASQMLKLLGTTGPTSPPNWLRGHLARLAAVTVRADGRFPSGLFEQLMIDEDPVVANWAAYALTRARDEEVKALGAKQLETWSKAGSALSAALLTASQATGEARTVVLKDALKAMRQATPQNREIMH